MLHCSRRELNSIRDIGKIMVIPMMSLIKRRVMWCRVSLARFERATSCLEGSVPYLAGLGVDYQLIQAWYQ